MSRKSLIKSIAWHRDQINLVFWKCKSYLWWISTRTWKKPNKYHYLRIHFENSQSTVLSNFSSREYNKICYVYQVLILRDTAIISLLNVTTSSVISPSIQNINLTALQWLMSCLLLYNGLCLIPFKHLRKAEQRKLVYNVVNFHLRLSNLCSFLEAFLLFDGL